MPPQTPAQSDPYGFILAPDQPKKPRFSFGGSLKRRIIVIVGIFVILIALTMVASSLLGRSGEAQSQKLSELAAAQTELVRLSTIGVDKATATETKSLAVNVQLSVESSRQATIGVLSKRGVKVQGKDLAAAKNLKSDTLLSQAARNNRFDQAFEELMHTTLANYQTLLRSAHDSGSANEKKVFASTYNGVGLLLPKAKN